MGRPKDKPRKSHDPASTSVPVRSEPPDRGRVSVEYTVGEVVDHALLQAGKDGATVARPTVPRHPPLITIEKVPRNFRTKTKDVEVRITYIRNDGEVKGVVVNPPEVVAQIEHDMETWAAASVEAWLPKIGVEAQVGGIKQKNKAGRNEFFTYAWHPDDEMMPIDIKILNLPQDWRPRNQDDTLAIQLTEVLLSGDKKSVWGRAQATDFPEVEDTDKAEQQMRDRLAQAQKIISADPPYGLLMERGHFIPEKRAGRWIIPNFDMGDEVTADECRLDVPADWNPDQLVQGKGLETTTIQIPGETEHEAEVLVFVPKAAKVEGGKLLVLAGIKGIEPPPKKTEAELRAEEEAAREVARKAREAAARPAERPISTRAMFDGLRAVVTPATEPAIKALVLELEKPEMNEPKQWRARKALLERVQAELISVRAALVTLVAIDDEAIEKLRKVPEVGKAVAAEIARVTAEIARAEAVTAPEMTALAAQLALQKQRRIDDLVRTKGRTAISARAKERVYNLQNGIFDGTTRFVGLDDIHDIAELRRLQAENAAVLEQQRMCIEENDTPVKVGDDNYELSEYAEDFLVAELMVPVFAERIIDVERAAAGQPAIDHTPPPPAAGDTGAPRPVPIGRPDAVPITAPATLVEAEAILEGDQLEDWFTTRGFVVGAVVHFPEKILRRFSRLFSADSPFENRLEIYCMAVGEDEIELIQPGPDAIPFVITAHELYAIAEDMVLRTVKQIQVAGIATNSLVTFKKPAIDALLKPQLKDWLGHHAGSTIPERGRVKEVDLPRGIIAIAFEGVPDIDKLDISLEEFARLVQAKNVAPVEGVTPFADGVTPEIHFRKVQGAGPASAEEKLLSEIVVAGQVYRFLRSGQRESTFTVYSVDETTGIVTLATRDAINEAGDNIRKAKKRQATREQWLDMLEKRRIEFYLGPEAKSGPVKARRESAEPATLPDQEVAPGQQYIYTGRGRNPILPNDELSVLSVSADPARVVFSIQRVSGKTFSLIMDQWQSLPKRLILVSTVSAAPEPAAGPAAPEPEEPPEDPSRSPNTVRDLLVFLQASGGIEQVRAAVNKASFLARTGVVDPVAGMIGDMTRVATQSKASLDKNRVLRGRAEADGLLELRDKFDELARDYEVVEAEAAVEVRGMFDEFTRGKVPAKAQDRLNAQLKRVNDALASLRTKQDALAQQLHNPTPPPAPTPTVVRRKGTT